jgi:integrase/recombinase XerD
VEELKVAELLDDFKDDCELRGMSPATIERYVSSLRDLGKYLGQKDIESADKETIKGFLDYLRRDRGLCLRTIENSFAAVSCFYDYLVYHGSAKENPVGSVRKRYLRHYKENDPISERKLISVDDMARLINSTLDIRNKAIITLLAKTGIRRKELISIDAEDIDWVEQSIKLKPTAKRSNRTVFFDQETAFVLRRWMKIREGLNKKISPALFLNHEGGRLARHGIYDAVVEAAKRIGLHNPDSDRMEDHFSPHCCRHWYTTHMRRAGMPREFIQELRGDVRREAIDIYDHIDKKELRESYLAHIPQLGI